MNPEISEDQFLLVPGTAVHEISGKEFRDSPVKEVFPGIFFIPQTCGE
jgi:hypothetical protein